MLDQKRNIEIEFRSIFDENRYNELRRFLDEKAQLLGEDDKDVFFFTLSDRLLKVVNNISKDNAKIVLKLNRIGKGSDFEEIDLSLSRDQVDQAVNIFTKLDIADNIMHSFQKRTNYIYHDVEIALKHSDVWGYHLELEIVVDDESKKQSAEQKIKEVAEELKIHLMTDQELADFTKNATEKYKQNTSK
ncbi:MAG: CYTH domain-containing protein [Candidatus Paceibacterota bacterium]|jgi:adenylate cyclase class IV